MKIPHEVRIKIRSEGIESYEYLADFVKKLVTRIIHNIGRLGAMTYKPNLAPRYRSYYYDVSFCAWRKILVTNYFSGRSR